MKKHKEAVAERDSLTKAVHVISDDLIDAVMVGNIDPAQAIKDAQKLISAEVAKRSKKE